MNRRNFLQSALYSGLIYGTGALPRFANEANAAFEPLRQRVLVNTFLNGGPDMRHLIVPEPSSNQSTIGYRYWSNRWRSHDIANNLSAWQARFNSDYFPIQVGGQNWASGLVDVGTKNSGVKFGVWREAGWLINLFLNGDVALAFNVAGGENRAHDHCSLQLNQGNVLSEINQSDRSGWGGRLARVAEGNIIAVTDTPQRFCFGPVGNAPLIDPNRIDNRDLVSVQNSREMGLNDFDLRDNQLRQPQEKMARALKSYYAALRDENISNNYEKFMDHEFKVRNFGELIRERLETVPLPPLMEALVRPTSIGGQAINPDPTSGDARRVLRNSYSFGRQMLNLYDVLAANDILDSSVVSLEYGGWDTHDDQRRNGGNADLDNPNLARGIESNFKDIFGGPYAGNQNALHGGFSALWESLGQLGNVNRNRLVFSFCGEFGRQIRDNGRGGTDHGAGNLMLMVGSNVRGGIYGEMFPDAELAKYDLPENQTPEIEKLTDIDYLFASVCDWVEPNSGNIVFPRIGDTSLPTEDQAIRESGINFSNMFV